MKLRIDSDSIYEMTHCCLEEGRIGLSRDVYLRLSMLKFYTNVMHHSMEVTLQEIEQPRRFSNQDSISQHYSETVMSRLSIVKDVREWAT